MNLLDPIKKIVTDRRNYLVNSAMLGEAFNGLLRYLELRETQSKVGVVTTINGGTTGLTPTNPTSGNVTLGGVLAASSGGTGLTGPFANGEVLIGDGSGLIAATLTPGPGITITNGPGSITVSTSSVPFSGDPMPNILMLMGG